MILYILDILHFQIRHLALEVPGLFEREHEGLHEELGALTATEIRKGAALAGKSLNQLAVDVERGVVLVALDGDGSLFARIESEVEAIQIAVPAESNHAGQRVAKIEH